MKCLKYFRRHSNSPTGVITVSMQVPELLDVNGNAILMLMKWPHASSTAIVKIKEIKHINKQTTKKKQVVIC